MNSSFKYGEKRLSLVPIGLSLITRQETDDEVLLIIKDCGTSPCVTLHFSNEEEAEAAKLHIIELLCLQTPIIDLLEVERVNRLENS
nr:MAG TPA: hypothetical protein [Caudoviricetes sp.]